MDFSTHNKFHSELVCFIFSFGNWIAIWLHNCLDRLHDDFISSIIYQKLNIPLFVYKTKKLLFKPTISTYFRLLEMTYIIEFLL